MADLDLVRRLVTLDHGLAVIAIARPNGTVHTSVVNAGVLDHPVTGQPVMGFVVRGDARKLSLVRRTKRVSVVFRGGWEWASVEGAATAIGPDDDFAGYDSANVPTLLRDIFKAAGGTHDDWDEYDRVMREERRTAVLVELERITSNQ